MPMPADAPAVATVNQGMQPRFPLPGGFGSLGAITGMTGGAPHPSVQPISFGRAAI